VAVAAMCGGSGGMRRQRQRRSEEAVAVAGWSAGGAWGGDSDGTGR